MPTQQPSDSFCRNCGASKLASDRFCQQCGAAPETGIIPTARVGPRPAVVQERSEPSVSVPTAALLILIIANLAWDYSRYFIVIALGGGFPTFFDAIIGPGGGVDLLAVLAVIGVATYYYYGERDTLFPRGWGPLVAIVGIALSTIDDMYFMASSGLSSFAWPTALFNWGNSAALLVLAYVEYKKELGPPKIQLEAAQLGSAPVQASLGVRHRIDELRTYSQTTQKRIGRELTLLIVVLPIIFFWPYGFLKLSHVAVAEVVLVAGAFFFFVLALRMRSWLKKSRFAIVDINRPHADAGKETLEGERGQLAIFLVIYGIMAGFTIELSLWWFQIGVNDAEDVLRLSLYGFYLLSALLCFFVGYRAFKQSVLGQIHVVEPSAVDELGESTGVMPVKVRTGETHSLLMDVDVVGRTSPASGHSSKYYELELRAPGVEIDSEKRCTLYEAPGRLVAAWSGFFRNAGTQAIQLVFSAVTPSEGATTAPARRETLFAYSHDVAVEGAFTASKENAITMSSIFVTVGGIVVGLLTFVPH